MRTGKCYWATLIAILFAGSVVMAAPADPSTVEIGGTLGLTQAEQHACLAVWVPVSQDLALNGIIWYNNDGNIAFPAISVHGGSPDYPVSLVDAYPVARDVAGESLGWSEVTFSEPVAALEAGFYVIFEIPLGGATTAAGAGGGPAIGYTSAATGLPGWLSADGEDWMGVHPDYGFAVIPQFVPRTDGMAAKTAARGGRNRDRTDGMAAGDASPTLTLLSQPAPNPFNPQTTLQFSLAQAGPVALDIYSLRGEHVKTLVSRTLTAGAHSAVWDGTNDDGAGLPSGVYAARLTAGPVVSVQRLTLVR